MIDSYILYPDTVFKHTIYPEISHLFVTQYLISIYKNLGKKKQQQHTTQTSYLVDFVMLSVCIEDYELFDLYDDEWVLFKFVALFLCVQYRSFP